MAKVPKQARFSEAQGALDKIAANRAHYDKQFATAALEKAPASASNGRDPAYNRDYSVIDNNGE